MKVEYREEPCKTALNPVKGMGFKWSSNPRKGLRPRLTFLTRPPLRAALGPPLRRPLRHLDPRQAERRRSVAQGTGALDVGARARGDRRGDGSVSAGGGPLP